MPSAMKSSAPADVRSSLARSRSAGLSFDEAWASATRDLRRGPWGDLDALNATRPMWKAAYTGLPHGCDSSFSLLASTRG